MKKRLIVGMTGASGVQYGLKLIEVLVESGHEVDLVISTGARKVMEYELTFDPEPILNMAHHRYDERDLGAPIASGTHPNQGMIIAPCSTKTLSAVANGYSDNLVCRAAECMLKENRPLVLVTRETPLNLIHLKNMVAAKEAGATILPASPGFYYKPQSVDDLINFVAGKVLNTFSIEHNLFKPWDPDKAKSKK